MAVRGPQRMQTQPDNLSMPSEARREDLKARLPAHLVDLVVEVEENREMEEALTASLQAAGFRIGDLQITFALGCASLEGTVSRASERDVAEALLRQDPRVNAVQNALRIR